MEIEVPVYIIKGKRKNIFLDTKSFIVSQNNSQNLRLSSSGKSSEIGFGVPRIKHIKIKRDITIIQPMATKNSQPVIYLMKAPPIPLPMI